MKDQDRLSDRPDKKDKKEKDGAKGPDKKLAKAVAKQVKKDLEKKLDKAVKQIRKETKKALEEVLEQALNRLDTDMKREIRAALGGTSPDRGPGDYNRTPDETDRDDARPNDVDAVTVDIEPDELHLADEIPVVEVDDVGEEDRAEGAAARTGEKAKRGGKKAKEAPAADPQNKGGQPKPPANPRKRGTAEAEIGSRTGAPASPMADADNTDA